MKHVVLTGFMAVGKTAVGRRLAKRLGYDFIDTDRLTRQPSHPDRPVESRRRRRRGDRPETAADTASGIIDGDRLIWQPGHPGRPVGPGVDTGAGDHLETPADTAPGSSRRVD